MDRRPPKEEWRTVNRRHRREEPGSGINGRQITKFFMPNLPDNCGKKEVTEALEGFGKIVNVYIAKKRNAQGQIFGFTSFVDVYDGLELQRKIGKVMIGGNKIKANIAKYAVENFDQRFDHLKRERNVSHSQQKSVFSNVEIKLGSSRADGGSYRDKLLNLKNQDIAGHTVIKNKVIQVSDNYGVFKELHGKAVIGKVLNFEVLRNLKSWMKEKLWDGYEVVYVGGLYLLIVFEEEGKANSFCTMEGWDVWFHSVEVWKGQTCPFERLAWLNVIGVPLHLSGKEVFDMIGGKFGRVVHLADPQVEGGDLSVGCIGVLREVGSIVEEEMKLSWKDLCFSVWVKEVGGSWIPDGTGKVSRRAEEDDLCADSSSESSESISMESSKSIQLEVEQDALEGEKNGLHGEHNILHGGDIYYEKSKVVGNKEFAFGSYVPFKVSADGNFEDVAKEKVASFNVFPCSKKTKRKVNIIKRCRVGTFNSHSQREGSLSHSPRPKKRNRLEDPFGLDFLFKNVNNKNSDEANRGPIEGLSDGNITSHSLDLNKSFPGDCEGNRGSSVEKGQMEESGSVRSVHSSPVQEVRESVDVSKKVGINLEGFECEVEEAILEEGVPDDPTRVTPIPIELDGENNVDIGLSHVHLYQQKIQEEVDATLNIASLIGVDLSGFVGLVEKQVMEDGV